MNDLKVLFSFPHPPPPPPHVNTIFCYVYRPTQKINTGVFGIFCKRKKKRYKKRNRRNYGSFTPGENFMIKSRI